jgi:hypothetical protein
VVVLEVRYLPLGTGDEWEIVEEERGWMEETATGLIWNMP